MRRVVGGLLGVVLVSGGGVVLLPTAETTPQVVAFVAPGGGAAPDRRAAGSAGCAAEPGRTTGAGPDGYVELGREATDRIFVIIAEFGDLRRAAAQRPPGAGRTMSALRSRCAR